MDADVGEKGAVDETQGCVTFRGSHGVGVELTFE